MVGWSLRHGSTPLLACAETTIAISQGQTNRWIDDSHKSLRFLHGLLFQIESDIMFLRLPGADQSGTEANEGNEVRSETRQEPIGIVSMAQGDEERVR